MGLENVCRKREGECGVMFIEVLCVCNYNKDFFGFVFGFVFVRTN